MIGGSVYRGKAIPALQGNYVFADFIVPTIGALVKEGKHYFPHPSFSHLSTSSSSSPETQKD
jgi:hypothetical protein